MFKFLLLVTLSLVLIQTTTSQRLYYTQWLRVYEYLHDEVSFDLAVKAEIGRIKAEAQVNDTIICEKLAAYGSVVGGVAALTAAITTDIQASASLFTNAGLFASAGLDAIAQLDVAVAGGVDIVAFANARAKEVVRVELLAQIETLALKEARIQQKYDEINITSTLLFAVSQNTLAFATGVTCDNIKSSGLLGQLLNPTDILATVVSQTIFTAEARIQLIDKLSLLLPQLANRVTADATLRAKAGLTFREVIDDLNLKTRQHFLATVARKIDSWAELKASFGFNDVNVTQRILFKRLRDYFDDYFKDATLLAAFNLDIQAVEASRFIQLNISYDASVIGLNIFTARVAFLARQFIYAFCHPFNVTVSSTTTSFVVIRIYPAPLFNPIQIIPLNYNVEFNTISNGSSVPPVATDVDFTALVTIKAADATSVKASLQAAFDDFNVTIRKAETDAQLFFQTAVQAYVQVDISSISAQIRTYASESFDLALLKSRAIAAGAQVDLTIKTVKAKVQEDLAKINATTVALARLEKGLSIQLVTLLSTMPSTSCNISTDFQTSLTSEQIYQAASVDTNCQSVVPILLKSLPIKRQLLLAILARKAHNATAQRVSAEVEARIKHFNDISVNISASISDRFQTPKPRETLHALWDSSEYKEALENCLLSLNNRSLTSVSVSVEVVSEVKRSHKVSAQADLTISGQTLQQANDNLMAQLPLCIAQISGGDLAYLKAKAQVYASAKRGIEQNSVGAQQETDTSSTSTITTTSSGGVAFIPALLIALLISLVIMF